MEMLHRIKRIKSNVILKVLIPHSILKYLGIFVGVLSVAISKCYSLD